LLEILKPKVYINSICSLDLKKLKKLQEIKGIIVDLDNTLVAWGENDVSAEVIDWVKEAKKLGLKLCIVSNTSSKRVAKFAEILDIPYYSQHLKPFSKSYIRGLKILNTKREETVVIGDQIFTDILGGNRLGFFTILVAPIIKRDSLGTFPQRTIEKIILSFWQKRGILKKEVDDWPAD